MDGISGFNISHSNCLEPFKGLALNRASSSSITYPRAARVRRTLYVVERDAITSVAISFAFNGASLDCKSSRISSALGPQMAPSDWSVRC